MKRFVLLRSTLLTLLMVFVYAALPMNAQTWLFVGYEDSTGGTGITLPNNTTYRLGVGVCWSDPVQTSGKATKLILNYPSGSFPFADPCPGQMKMLEVQERGAAYAVTIASSGSSTTLNVPKYAASNPTIQVLSFATTLPATVNMNGIVDTAGP